jgi:hypothetical protein
VNEEERYLEEAIHQAPPAGIVRVQIGRRDERAPREAHLHVRYRRLELLPPRHHKGRKELRALELGVILAQEEQPEKGDEPVRWLLLTSLPLESLGQAAQCIAYYSRRWLVERYHYVLKSGCRVEELQLESAERLERALATYAVVAWRLLWLTYAARQAPNAPCTIALDEQEWQALFCLMHKEPAPPAQPPTLAEAVRAIAQLGGFLAREADGPPGVKTIWRGLTRLHDITIGFHLPHSQSPLFTYG